jgi:subtilase family serine protease
MRDEVRFGAAQPMAQMSKNQMMRLDLVLPLSDPQALDALLADIYNPSSPNFHHFLSVSEFTAKFGPTQEQYEAVLQFAKANGLVVTGGSRDGMDVQVKGRVAAVEKAFHVRMAHYPRTTGEGGTYYAPDREPSTDLPFNLWHVSGMDNFSIPRPRLSRRSEAAAARGIMPEAVVNHATTGSGPQASFLGSDMRAAYYGGTALTGAGQNVGLLEFLGTDLVDLNNYYKAVGQTNTVPITLLSTDGTSTSCIDNAAGGNCDDT